MKYSGLFISIGICCILISGCKQPQSQTVSTNDDVVWKATVSYCVSKEKMDLNLLKYDIESEACNIHNFKIIEQSGSMRKLVDMLYDSAFLSKTYPLYAVDVVNNINPAMLLLPKERRDIIERVDTVMDENGKPKAVVTKIDSSQVKGVTICHEWMYDSKANTLKSTITDASLFMPVTDGRFGAYIQTMCGFKFSNRSADSGGSAQEVLKPEIACAMDILFPITYDPVSGPKLQVFESDSIQCVANGVSSKPWRNYTTPLKKMFGKKLVELIWDASRKGLIPSYYYVGEDKIGEPIPASDLKKVGVRIDTVRDENEKQVIITNDVKADLLSGLEIREEISFNRSSFSFESKITYVGIMEMCTDKTNTAIPNESKTIYWVKFN